MLQWYLGIGLSSTAGKRSLGRLLTVDSATLVPMGVRAVIFDMDGVLIDSEPLWRLAEQEVFSAVGLQLTDSMCESTMGLRIDEVVAFWYRHQPWTGKSQDAVAQEVVVRVGALIEERGQALPGVADALQRLHEAGLLLGLASSSSPELIETVVRKLGIGHHFAAICSALEVTRGKPYPDVFLATAGKLGVPPRTCVAVEDSVRGLDAAVAAGMGVIAVPSAEQGDDPAFAAAVRLDSLNQLTPAVLRRAAAAENDRCWLANLPGKVS